MRKRLLAAALVLCMVMSILPVQTAAYEVLEDGTEVEFVIPTPILTWEEGAGATLVATYDIDAIMEKCDDARVLIELYKDGELLFEQWYTTGDYRAENETSVVLGQEMYETGTYTAKVRVDGTKDHQLVGMSEYATSEPYYFTKPLKSLDTPQNLQITDRILTWEADNNRFNQEFNPDGEYSDAYVGSYYLDCELYENGKKKAGYGTAFNLDKNEYNLNELFAKHPNAPSGTYTISLRAVSNLTGMNRDEGIRIGHSDYAKIEYYYDNGSGDTPSIPLTINHSAASLTVGDTLELSVSGGDSTAKTVWTSSNEKVVSVNNGMITGVAPGTATVTATKGNGTAKCQVTVSGLAMPQKVYLNYNDVKNSPYTLKATTYPTDLGVAWTSSDESVATVSGTGATANISVLKAGSTDISADFTVNGVQMCSTCRVYVIKPDDITLTKGKTSTISLDMSIFPQGATVKTTSMDTTVATVSGMKVTGVNPGQTKIKLEVVNGKETLAVLDCSATTRGVMITKQLNMDVGAEHTITAQSFPKIGYGVSWTSSDPDIVSVSNGKLTAKKVGTATITATQTMIGVPTPLSSKCVVTVKDPVTKEDIQNVIDQYVNYALSRVGTKTSRQCAGFVSDCARKVPGVSEVIPFNSYCCVSQEKKGKDYALFESVIKQGGTKISPEQAKPGDLLFMTYDYEHNRDIEDFDHVGIIVDVDVSKKMVYIVHANWHCGKHNDDLVCGPDNKQDPSKSNGRCHNSGYKGYAHSFDVSTNHRNPKNYPTNKVYYTYVRPNYYKAAEVAKREGKINGTYKCPIEAKISYNGEELNSSTGKWLTSFGTMWRDGEGVSFSIDYGNPYDYEITGTGTGTMDLEISYDTNDGANTRKFLNVPITKTTTAYVFANNADMGVEMLVVDNAVKDNKIWYAEPNETVTAHNSELTESYNQQDQNGIDLPSSGSTGGGSSSGGSTVAKPEDKKPEETVKKASEIFVDVEAGSWYEEAVTFAVEKGLFKGVDETHFAPAVTTTRAMIMTVLARLDGHKADTYDEAVKWAVDSGVSDGSNINAVITREQFVTMLYRYAEQPEASGELTGFSDMTEVSDWAWVAMSWAVDNGIIKGNEQSQLSPKAAATRAEAAAIMQRYITLIEK